MSKSVESETEADLWNHVIGTLHSLCCIEIASNYTMHIDERMDSRKSIEEEKARLIRQLKLARESRKLLISALDSVSALTNRQTGQGKANNHQTLSEYTKNRKRKAIDTEPKTAKRGRSFNSSPYNPSDPILVGSEVAFKLKGQRGASDEWIQCEVTRIYGDGTKFEVQDPEPDENNNPGQSYKATAADVILIPSRSANLPSYSFGSRVLARYPETTTFYPAEVMGTKRDGRCRLRFEGEEEEGKETEVERRHVLPAPN